MVYGLRKTAVSVGVVALFALRLISSSPVPAQLLNLSPLPAGPPSGNEQVGRDQLPFSSPWDPQQFNLPFSVQAEEISDEEWHQMMTDDLRRHNVLGQIVDTVPPYIVNVDYADNACVHMGNQLVPRQTKLPPNQVNFPTNGSGGLMTLMAIDPDVPSQNNSIYSEFLQWLVVNIPDENIERGDVLAEYLGPLPSHKGGQHRFIFLAHKQPNGSIINTAALPHAESCDWASRARFSARKFAKIHRLGEPMAINYFTTQFDSSVPLAIEQCLLRRQSLIHIQQRLSLIASNPVLVPSAHSMP